MKATLNEAKAMSVEAPSGKGEDLKVPFPSLDLNPIFPCFVDHFR